MILEWKMGMQWRQERAGRVMATSEASIFHDADIQRKPQMLRGQNVTSEDTQSAEEAQHEKKRMNTD
jgi:hypothetical protein